MFRARLSDFFLRAPELLSHVPADISPATLTRVRAVERVVAAERARALERSGAKRSSRARRRHFCRRRDSLHFCRPVVRVLLVACETGGEATARADERERVVPRTLRAVMVRRLSMSVGQPNAYRGNLWRGRGIYLRRPMVFQRLPPRLSRSERRSPFFARRGRPSLCRSIPFKRGGDGPHVLGRAARLIEGPRTRRSLYYLRARRRERTGRDTNEQLT